MSRDRNRNSDSAEAATAAKLLTKNVAQIEVETRTCVEADRGRQRKMQRYMRVVLGGAAPPPARRGAVPAPRAFGGGGSPPAAAREGCSGGCRGCAKGRHIHVKACYISDFW
jgi:hypothetical protein